MESKELKGDFSELSRAYAKAQAEVRDAAKDARNPHFGNDYATLRSVLQAVRPIFAKYDLALYQAPGKIVVLEPGTYAVCVQNILIHGPSGQMLATETQVPVSGRRDKKTGAALPIDPPAYGSALSYARRYALAAIAGITQTDDDGGSATQTYEPSPETAPEDVAALRELIDGASSSSALESLRASVRTAGKQDLIDAFLARKAKLESVK